MTAFRYDLDAAPICTLGLIILQSDVRIELDFRHILPADLPLLGSRVPSAVDVTPDTLQEIGLHLTDAAARFPYGAPPDVVGYGCTSGTAQVGVGEVAARVHMGCGAARVTEPVSALIAACRALGLRRLALLSPYVQPVSRRLQDVLAAAGVETPAFGSFEEALEERVARISAASTIVAARALVEQAEVPVDGLFLSCTNLPTLDVIGPLENATGLPVLSSNLVLAWHMLTIAERSAAPGVPGRLFAQAPPG